MGGDTTITGGQNLAQTQAAQTSGQKKTTAPAEPMPIMSMAEDQHTTKAKPAGGKVPTAAVSFEITPDDGPEKAAQKRLLKFSQDVVKAHESELEQGKPLRLTDDELVNLMEMTEDIVDSDDLLGAYYFRQSFQGMFSALAASVAELRNPPKSPDKPAAWSATDEESLAQVKAFTVEFLDIMKEVANTEKNQPDAGEPANKRHIRMMEKLHDEIQGDVPKLLSSTTKAVKEERETRAFDAEQRTRIEKEKMGKVGEGLTLGAAGAVAVGLAVYKRHALVSGLKKTPQTVKAAGVFLKDLGISVGTKLGRASVRRGRSLIMPVVVRVRDLVGITPAALPKAEAEMLAATRKGFESAIGGKPDLEALIRRIDQSSIFKFQFPGYKGKFDNFLQDAIQDTRREIATAIKAGSKEAAALTEKEIAEIAAAKAYLKLTKVPGILGSLRYTAGEALRGIKWMPSWVPAVTDKIPLVGTLQRQPTWRIHADFDRVLKESLDDVKKDIAARIKAGDQAAAKLTAEQMEKLAAERALQKLGRPVMNWEIGPIAGARQGVAELSWASAAQGGKVILGKARSAGVGGAIFGVLQESPEVASGRISGNHFLGNVSRMITGFAGFEVGGAAAAAGTTVLFGTPPGWVVTTVTLVGGLAIFALTDHKIGKDVSNGVTRGLDWTADKTGVNVGTGVKYVVYPLGKGVDWVEHNTGGFGRFTRNWLLKPFDEADREGGRLHNVPTPTLPGQHK